jgi:membrane-bound lytic murein transglycosylase D
MPRETQYYVPKLQAIKNIVREPTKYGITLPAIRNEPYFVAVTKTRDIDVETAAKLAEMSLEEFRALNPAFNRPVIVGAAQPNILLPADRGTTFLANLAAWEATGQPLASWTTYTLRPNETLTKVADRVGVSEAHLREANRVPPRYKLAAGSTILIPRDETMEADIAPEKLAASFALIPETSGLRRITYRVRRGDTLHSVARRWRVSTDEIVAWNNLRSTQLFAGQRLTLTVRATPTKRRAARASKTAPSAVRSRSSTVRAKAGGRFTASARGPR